MKKWRAISGAYVFLLAPILLGSASGASAVERSFSCASVSIIVEGGETADRKAACQGANDAVSFLERQGLSAGQPIRLAIVDKLPAAAGATAIGMYMPETKTAYLLRFSRLSTKIRRYDLPLTRGLYRSLATHEVTHALTAALFSQSRPMIFAEEYIAYVAMLDSMTPRHRKHLLAMFPGPGFEKESHINIITYQFEPLQFGVFSYRHYLRPENGPTFIRRILAGQALALDLPG